MIDFNSKYISNNKEPVKKSKYKKKKIVYESDSSESSDSEDEKPIIPKKKVNKSKKDIKIDDNFNEYYSTCLENILDIINEPVKKEELVKYKNEKLIDIIKGFFEKINTIYGKSYLEINKQKKDYIKDNIKNYVKYFMKTDNKDILMHLLQQNNYIFI